MVIQSPARRKGTGPFPLGLSGVNSAAMKLVTYVGEGGNRHGALVGDRILDLVAGIAAMEKSSAASVAEKYGADLLGLIERQDVAMPVAREAVRRAAELPPSVFVDASRPGGVELLAPIPRPPSMRDGYAFRQHVETARRNRGLEMIPEFDQFPVFYFTNHQAVIGPGPLRVKPRHLERLDFELEAAIVDRSRGSRPDGRQRRRAHLRHDDHERLLGARAADGGDEAHRSAPPRARTSRPALGPYLVTMDELADQHADDAQRRRSSTSAMRAFVNGVQVSTGNVKDMTWTFAQILERASYGVDALPGRRDRLGHRAARAASSSSTARRSRRTSG